MSKAKFLAAKELIQEGNYDEARTILQTINHPTATKWLARIDQIHQDKQVSSTSVRQAQKTANSSNESITDKHDQRHSEQDKFYKRENRRARLRNIGNGIDIIMLGMVLLAAWAFFSGLLFGIQVSTGPLEGTNLVMFGVGILVISLGFFRVVK